MIRKTIAHIVGKNWNRDLEFSYRIQKRGGLSLVERPPPCQEQGRTGTGTPQGRSIQRSLT
jgi:hypothetical protein